MIRLIPEHVKVNFENRFFGGGKWQKNQLMKELR